MRRIVGFLIFISLALPSSAGAAEYALNAGDVLRISVWKEEDMQQNVLVLPDGMVSFPLAGHIQAAGKSAAQVEAEVVKRIKRYISDPVVTVSVANVSGYRIYVIGQVNRPGEFAVTRPIDVLQALSLAGGLTAFGDEDDIRVLRRENGTQRALKFDYSKVKNGKNLELNVVLQAGDTVVVSD